MGTLKRFNLNRIIREYNIEYLFETGTWKGDGIAYASNAPFKKLYSSEIIEEIAKKAKERFIHNNKIEIIYSNSTDAISNNLRRIQGNCLFWLDAHFPGAEEGLNDYNDIKEDDIKLPLQKEIEIISLRTKEYKDIILIDDLRIYEDGPYKSGNMPEHIVKPLNRSINFVEKEFSTTHYITRSFWDEGYLLIFPKIPVSISFFNSLRYNFYNSLRNKIY